MESTEEEQLQGKPVQRTDRDVLSLCCLLGIQVEISDRMWSKALKVRIWRSSVFGSKDETRSVGSRVERRVATEPWRSSTEVRGGRASRGKTGKSRGNYV